MAPEIAQSIQFTPPASFSPNAQQQRLSANQNVRTAEERRQQAAQDTQEARVETRQADSRLRQAQEREQQAAQEVRQAQAERQRVIQSTLSTGTGTIVDVLV